MSAPPPHHIVAGIIWSECWGIRASRTQTCSPNTYAHRHALGIVVCNRARQDILWGVRPGTMPPSFPTNDQLRDAANVAAWDETVRAGFEAAEISRSLSLDDARLLLGAQYYCHTFGHAWRTARRGYPWVKSFEAWDPRDTIVSNGVTYDGPMPVWLNVHIDERHLARCLARAAGQ